MHLRADPASQPLYVQPCHLQQLVCHIEIVSLQKPHAMLLSDVLPPSSVSGSRLNPQALSISRSQILQDKQVLMHLCGTLLVSALLHPSCNLCSNPRAGSAGQACPFHLSGRRCINNGVTKLTRDCCRSKVYVKRASVTILDIEMQPGFDNQAAVRRALLHRPSVLAVNNLDLGLSPACGFRCSLLLRVASVCQLVGLVVSQDVGLHLLIE